MFWNIAVAVPPSAPAGGVQAGSHDTKLTPDGRTIESWVLLKIDGPRFCPTTTKSTDSPVGTGSGLAEKELIARSAVGVGVGVGDGVGVGVGVGGAAVKVQFRVTLPNSLFQPSTAMR
jgi:hypothetical protein